MRSWRDKFRALGLEGLGSKVWGGGEGGGGDGIVF